MSSIVDKAEVSIDFPDKAYMGGFGRDSSFQARATPDQVVLRLERPGEDRRVAEIHLHYYLFADILDAIASSLSQQAPIDDLHRAPLAAAAARLCESLERKPADER